MAFNPVLPANPAWTYMSADGRMVAVPSRAFPPPLAPSSASISSSMVAQNGSAQSSVRSGHHSSGRNKNKTNKASTKPGMSKIAEIHWDDDESTPLPGPQYKSLSSTRAGTALWATTSVPLDGSLGVVPKGAVVGHNPADRAYAPKNPSSNQSKHSKSNGKAVVTGPTTFMVPDNSFGGGNKGHARSKGDAPSQNRAAIEAKREGTTTRTTKDKAIKGWTTNALSALSEVRSHRRDAIMDRAKRYTLREDRGTVTSKDVYRAIDSYNADKKKSTDKD